MEKLPYRFCMLVPCLEYRMPLPRPDRELRNRVLAGKESLIFGVAAFMRSAHLFTCGRIGWTATLLTDEARTCTLPPPGTVLVSEYPLQMDTMLAMLILEQRARFPHVKPWPQSAWQRVRRVERHPFSNVRDVQRFRDRFPVSIVTRHDLRLPYVDRLAMVYEWLVMGVMP